MKEQIKTLLSKWGDKIIATGQWGMNSVAAIPLFVPAASIPLLTSIPIASFLALFSLVFWSWGQKQSMYSSAFGSLVWALIAIIRS